MIDEKNLYKTITANVDGTAVTKHKIAIGKDDKIIVFSSTQKFRPRNRKQKKAMKKIGSSVKKIDKNTYLVTEECVMNMELLAKMLKCVVRVKDNGFWFDVSRFKND